MTGAPTVQATVYEVRLLPEDLLGDHDLWAITVEYRGGDLWAVKNKTRLLGRGGTWSHGPADGEDLDRWRAEHRFPLDEAITLAKDWAGRITVGGRTAADVLARRVQ